LLETNNNPLIGTRAFTLPDMGAATGTAGANGFSLLHNDSKNALDDHPITFYAPELPAETLLDVSLVLQHGSDKNLLIFWVFFSSASTMKHSPSSISSWH
jgi:hypothetical protein